LYAVGFVWGEGVRWCKKALKKKRREEKKKKARIKTTHSKAKEQQNLSGKKGKGPKGAITRRKRKVRILNGKRSVHEKNHQKRWRRMRGMKRLR